MVYHLKSIELHQSVYKGNCKGGLDTLHLYYKRNCKGGLNTLHLY